MDEWIEQEGEQLIVALDANEDLHSRPVAMAFKQRDIDEFSQKPNSLVGVEILLTFPVKWRSISRLLRRQLVECDFIGSTILENQSRFWS
jgi:hypothetical protein